MEGKQADNEIYLRTDTTIAFSRDRRITIGVPLEMEERLGLEEGDWIAIRRLTPEEAEKLLKEKALGPGT